MGVMTIGGFLFRKTVCVQGCPEFNIFLGTNISFTATAENVSVPAGNVISRKDGIMRKKVGEEQVVETEYLAVDIFAGTCFSPMASQHQLS